MTINLKVDVYNPAEYYAAMGLLELASQQDDRVLAYFDTDATTGPNSAFVLQGDVQMPDLRKITFSEMEYGDSLVAPVLLDGKIELNWWLNQYRTGKSTLKLWAGGSRPFDMLSRYQGAIGVIDEDILQRSIKTKTGKSSFGFDTRAIRDALSLGYSQNEAGDESILFPATEFLCAIGLQNFRPTYELSYFVWRRSIPVSIAHAAAVQEIPGLEQDAYGMSIQRIGRGLRAVDKVSKLDANLTRSARVYGCVHNLASGDR